ncbi:MAG TPA: FAD-dependent oxidoreductase [Patescibacteria group bacterium]|nr:FAD-dependent oxidoreductase [Patescibacteria group bacterium]
MHAHFHHSDEIAKDIRSFWFKLEKPCKYTAGQFTELSLPHTADKRGQRRWFTISSSPNDPLLSITTKFTTGRSSTFKKTLRTLRPGDPVKLAEPMGDFVLPKDASIPLIFIAGGIGITPMHSMIKFLYDTHEQRNIQLVYATTTAEELAFLQLLQTYSLSLTTIVKHPLPPYSGLSGSLDTDRILTITTPTPETLIYLAGPEPMVELLTKGLIAKGISPQQIVTDYFHGYQRF